MINTILLNKLKLITVMTKKV